MIKLELNLNLANLHCNTEVIKRTASCIAQTLTTWLQLCCKSSGLTTGLGRLASAGVDEEAILMEALTEAAEDERLDNSEIAKIGSEDEFDG